jgi:hypothetical protein
MEVTLKQLRFNVRDAYQRVTGKPMTSAGDLWRDGFYAGYMARCDDQRRYSANKKAIARKGNKL